MGTLFRRTGTEVKSGLASGFRKALDILYPPQCLGCDAAVLEPGTLCARCWSETVFLTGLCCDSCATPLPGPLEDAPLRCDECLHSARPWSRARAALVYGGTGRRLVLALKHGDRQEIARPAAQWLARHARPLLRPDTLIVPVPLHRWRLFRRRYNQSALLSGALARLLERPHLPDLLRRPRATGSQDGRSRSGRFQNLQGTIRVHPRHVPAVEGRHVLLVDDVMTSGATLAAASEACFAAGADDVDVIVLARVLRAE